MKKVDTNKKIAVLVYLDSINLKMI